MILFQVMSRRDVMCYGKVRINGRGLVPGASVSGGLPCFSLLTLLSIHGCTNMSIGKMKIGDN